ncbi:MAG: stage V sporulation protein AA [Romboutsia sp.]
MEEIYLTPKDIKPYKTKQNKIYLSDIYSIYPKGYGDKLSKIIVRKYDDFTEKYDVIHLGEIIELINHNLPKVHINFMKKEDIVIYFENSNKDRTKYLRVLLVCIVVTMGSIMGIMNFHADVNMDKSQFKIVDSITNNGEKYLPYFQIPYSIGIGVGVALFFNKLIPTYSKNEPSPLDLRIISLNKEVENQLRNKRK